MSASKKQASRHPDRTARLARSAGEVTEALHPMRIATEEAVLVLDGRLTALAEAIDQSVGATGELLERAQIVLDAAALSISEGRLAQMRLPGVRAHDPSFRIFDAFVRIWMARVNQSVQRHQARRAHPANHDSTDLVAISDARVAALCGLMAASVAYQSSIISMIVDLGFDAPLVAGALERSLAWAADVERICIATAHELIAEAA